MINFLTKVLLKRELVLYNKHRQTIPIVNNHNNRKKYIFLQSNKILSKIPVKSSHKLKYRIAYILLKILSPKYVIDINWISRMSALYYVWSKKSKNSKFIVVQHGSYIGGNVTDIAHRYTNCDVFLVWGNYFKVLFENYNKGKKISVVDFGNPIYNKFKREKFYYKNKTINKILLAPSGIKDQPLEQLYKLHDKLIELGFVVKLKEHSMQTKFYTEIKKISKESEDSEKLLKNQNYDIIISDHSSIILDAIFFKNPVICFSSVETKFTSYMDNAFYKLKDLKNKEDLLNLLNIKTQEVLFSDMITLNPDKNEL
jgi:hypothetical protein